MESYYTGKRATSYNRIWKTFSAKTLTATCSVIDLTQLQVVARKHGKYPRILDVACGTGLLLQQLSLLIPQAELYGVDASQDMLFQARLLLENYPYVYFTQASLKDGEMVGLPYEPGSFDLITCTNALHYLDNPAAVLRGLAQLLVPQGQMVIEDYARRTFPFPWRLFTCFMKHVDPQYKRAYTLKEAQTLCQVAGLQVTTTRAFSIDLLWQGWVIQAHCLF
ncbi:MAG TPA: class I SAM-dependent methyltransferase [Ktedonobacteraceae bacterium]|jgi:ubiquinone/menaquinone biosynthesis C-methylase UbiE